MNDQELREVVKRLAETQEETFRHMRAEQEGTFRHIRAEQAKTERFLKEVSRQLGDLGRKFGGYIEGLALPAVKKLLHERFKMDVVGEYLLARKK